MDRPLGLLMADQIWQMTKPARRCTDVTDSEMEAALAEALPVPCEPCDGKGGWWREGRWGEVWAVCAACEGFGTEDRP